MTIFTLILIFHFTFLGQQEGFDLNKIKFRGLDFFVTKEKVIATFGEPKIIDPEYECGFYSNNQTGGPYYQLMYDNFNYIGSETENFQLENVEFDIKGEIRLAYGDYEISGLTTKNEFAKLFGKYPDDDVIIIFSEGSDDGARFRFKDEKLIKFEYWSPC